MIMFLDKDSTMQPDKSLSEEEKTRLMNWIQTELPPALVQRIPDYGLKRIYERQNRDVALTDEAFVDAMLAAGYEVKRQIYNLTFFEPKS
jgi:hypothetical protein